MYIAHSSHDLCSAAEKKILDVIKHFLYMTIITGVSHREKNKIQVSIINKKEQHGGSFLASNPIFDLFSSLNEKLSVTAILREKKKNKFRSRSEKKMITSSNLLSRQNASYCLHVFLFAKSNFWSQMRTF